MGATAIPDAQRWTRRRPINELGLSLSGVANALRGYRSRHLPQIAGARGILVAPDILVAHLATRGSACSRHSQGFPHENDRRINRSANT